MAKTQPLLTVPQTKINKAAVTVAPGSAPVATTTGFDFDAVPMPICWTIFGISTVTLLIQIWNYLSL